MGTDATFRGMMKITNVQLSFTGIEMTEVGQKNIEGFFKGDLGRDGNGRKRKLDRALTPSDGEAGSGEVVSDARDRRGLDDMGDLLSFLCERCHRRITLPSRWEPGDGHDEEERKRRLKSLQSEHADYHFAQDLTWSPEPKKKKKREKEKEPEGIAKFFTRKG